MSEKKMVRRNVAVALGIICIILAVSLVGAFEYYTPIINDKNSMITNLQNQTEQLQTYLNGSNTLLSQTQTWLVDNVTYYTIQNANLQTQITNLQNQLSNFTMPILGFSDLTAEDNRTTPETPHLHVNGTVHNFGIEATTLGPPKVWPRFGTFYFLYVKAYHNDGSVALETPEPDSFLGNINGQSSINVDLNYYYNGSALSSWTINLEKLFII